MSVEYEVGTTSPPDPGSAEGNFMTGFSHCTKIVPVKSHNDFSRPLVKKGVV